MSSEAVNVTEIEKAFARVSTFLEPTPVQSSCYIDSLVGKNVFFKCENFQKTGSFKVRGALNTVLKRMSPAFNTHGYKGCVTHSSGNHGQALAWACDVNKVPCSIVLPKGTPEVKVSAVKGYNAELVFCENNPVSRVEFTDRISVEKNYAIVNPYDDYDVMCGQGTVALEFLRQVPQLDAILVSVSGGGLISGISVYAKLAKPSIKIIAVEPEKKRLSESLHKNERDLDHKPQADLETLAEGIRLEQCGEMTFPIMRKYIEADDVLTVSDSEMIKATKLVFERMKLVIELSAGAAVAAVMSNEMKQKYPDLKNVGLIVCGGNIDLDRLPWYSSEV